MKAVVWDRGIGFASVEDIDSRSQNSVAGNRENKFDLRWHWLLLDDACFWLMLKSKSFYSIAYGDEKWWSVGFFRHQTKFSSLLHILWTLFLPTSKTFRPKWDVSNKYIPRVCFVCVPSLPKWNLHMSLSVCPSLSPPKSIMTLRNLTAQCELRHPGPGLDLMERQRCETAIVNSFDRHFLIQLIS